jgi:hypothetical protein
MSLTETSEEQCEDGFPYTPKHAFDVLSRTTTDYRLFRRPSATHPSIVDYSPQNVIDHVEFEICLFIAYPYNKICPDTIVLRLTLPF